MDALVIGAGVVGLATSRALARRGWTVIVAEASGSFGSGVSSRNSEVIHAGMYYPADTLRAVHCVQGARLMYDFCATYGVPHQRRGKLIVATSEDQVAQLEIIKARGDANGVRGLRLISATEARKLEPNLACVAALQSPDTGIIDTHSFMLALVGDIEANGGTLALRSPVERLTRDTSWTAHFGGHEPGSIAFDVVVNAAGLGSQPIAASTEGYPAAQIPEQYLCKRSYFSYGRPAAFSRLIYPVPSQGLLGIHLTLDMAGRMRFGPDMEWVNELDYRVNSARATTFYDAVRRYWPGLPDGSLIPDYAGIRPRLTGPGEAAMDFRIDGPLRHGLPGLVALFGIESPGLTSSLSIAEQVVDTLER
ncbi:FAD-dependent oxidoreductase [Bradyrhizobium sp. NAS80.1]|uniref:NAD(P)/FAD-dependent oxidoreductase n=1 Tax=Bradyrhizobium sp. NAS80.1 TaxID=1680159 RepID=UPI0009647480|nr:NAD(P)/FAD-dependent oxidoreductase [Bradyrhizobium sp. NAS80.1]OKO84766.1 FAD-dependent oxidoreductase [Bradyrhizobium sp. NAS80.1]